MILIVLGISIISLSQIVNHYIQIPDFIHGICKGAGIGILVIAIITLIRLKKLTST
ncbi:hypothetical protein [uncultured Kordia sp.]|uniref:hypothetical protein n=1 Tax=uncultured Kordia sp. TaxID=507699 RepID=UPI00261A0A20|nr:hypothetical protein [uncultured Kordia sp.]